MFTRSRADRGKIGNGFNPQAPCPAVPFWEPGKGLFCSFKPHPNTMKRFIDFKQIKRDVGIRRILEHYTLLPNLKEQGDRLSGGCPICKTESRTAFRVSQEKNCFKCFSCDAGGNILDLVCGIEDCSIREAAERIADWFEIECGKGRRVHSDLKSPRSRKLQKSEETSESRAEVAVPVEHPEPNEGVGTSPAPEISQSQENDEPDAPGANQPKPVSTPLSFELKLDPKHPWFGEAGIQPETVSTFGLGYCFKGMMRGRIAFPLRNGKSELLGYAGLWPESPPPADQACWKFPKNLDLKQLVYPADRAAGIEPDRMLLAMSPLEVIRVWQSVELNVFWVPCLISHKDLVERLTALGVV